MVRWKGAAGARNQGTHLFGKERAAAAAFTEQTKQQTRQRDLMFCGLKPSRPRKRNRIPWDSNQRPEGWGRHLPPLGQVSVV